MFKKDGIIKVLIILVILNSDIINKKLFLDSNKKFKISNIRIASTIREVEERKKLINIVKLKLHLKNELSYKIAYILDNTEYKNTDIDQYINYTKLLKSTEKIEINNTLIDPSKLLIEPFFTKEFINKLNLNILNNQEKRFDPMINTNVEFYLEKYFIYICRNKILLDKNRYKKSKHPKLSIIVPVYNRARYIENGLISIQNQNLKDIEIIYIDDKSKDNSTEIIKKFMKEDDRIILLKNKKNSGPFYTRLTGLVFSKGSYISFIDSDDFYLPDILGNAYNIGIKNNVEIVQWTILQDNPKGGIEKGVEYHTSHVVLTHEILKYYMFYDHHENYAKIENYFIVDKIYKRELLLRTMHKLHDDIINENLRIHEDNLFLFLIFQNAKSYYYINQYGYYWYRADPKSTTNDMKSIENANKSLHDIFIILKFIFNYTPDEKKFKMMCLADFECLISAHEHKLKYANEGLEFVKEVLYLYLNCKFYSTRQKKKLFNFIKVVNENQAGKY